MATTMKLIAKNILASDAADVTFSSIPGTYTDLLLVCSARTARATDFDVLAAQFNGSTTSYSTRYLESSGSGSPNSGTFSEFWVGLASTTNNTASTFGNSECYIPNYAGSTNKSASATGASETNATTAGLHLQASLWSNTAAITSIKVFSRVSANLKSGSSFYLYGITKSA